MLPDDLLQQLANDLDSEGRAVAKDKAGNRLIVTTGHFMKLGSDEMILVYEGKGVAFFQLDRPMNKFRLMAGGLTEPSAIILSDMVNRLIPVLATRRQVEATGVALEGPSK